MKPYNLKIIKLMAEHSDEAAAYASFMKWDFWRRQKVENVTSDETADECALCDRHRYRDDCSAHNGECLLHKKQDGHCHDGIYGKVLEAIDNNDQRAFTENANALCEQIRSIIDDFYKPKKEVFYHIGQRFRYWDGDAIYKLVSIGCEGGGAVVMLVREDSGRGWWNKRSAVEDEIRITEAEFNKICGDDKFILVEDSK